MPLSPSGIAKRVLSACACLRFARPARVRGPSLANARFEQREEIDDVGRDGAFLFRVVLGDLSRLRLLSDDLHHVGVETVLVLLRLEVAHHPFDELFRHRLLAGGDVDGVRDGEVLDVAELVPEAQHLEHERVADGHQRDEVLLGPEHERRDRDRALLREGVAEQHVGLRRALLGDDEVGRLEERGVDLIEGDEVLDVDRLGRLDVGFGDLLLLEDDELVLLDLEAFHDVVPRHFFSRLRVDAEKPHRRQILLVEHAEVDLFRPALRGDEGDRDLQEAKADRARPRGARSSAAATGVAGCPVLLPCMMRAFRHAGRRCSGRSMSASPKRG